MCGRVRLSSDVSEIKLVFSIPPDRPTPNFPPSWNVAPTDTLPVVRYDTKAAQRNLDMLRWGLIPYWAKDIKVGFANINAKAEGIDSKPAFRKSFERRRCLVPADNFYEWVRREVVCVIVRRRHPAGPAVPSAVPYEVGRVGNNPSKSPRTMYPANYDGHRNRKGTVLLPASGRIGARVDGKVSASKPLKVSLRKKEPKVLSGSEMRWARVLHSHPSWA